MPLRVLPGMVTDFTGQDLQELLRRLESLEESNRQLAAQVKRLVKAENELYRVQEQVDGQIRLYRQLYEVGKQFTASFDLSYVLRLITRFVLYELGFERCLVFLRAGEGTHYGVHAMDGYYDEQAAQQAAALSLSLDEPSLAPLLTGAMQVICPPGCAETALVELGRRLGMDEYVVLPLGGEAGQPLGLLAVGNTQAGAPYQTRIEPGSDEMIGLDNLASHASTALNSIKSYQALRESEQKYRALFEDSKDAIFITTPAGQVLDVNQAMLDLFGYSRAEMLQLSATQLYANPADRLEYQRILEQTGSLRDHELRLCKKDGTVIDCLLTVSVRRGENGRSLAYQGIIRDITERKRAEKERLQIAALRRELAIAQDIQRQLLPPSHPDWPRPQVRGYTAPAREVGGDFYTFARHPQNDNSFLLAVGDVTGKGLPAALLMAVSLASLQAIVGQYRSPADLLARLDRALVPYTVPTHQNCALVYVEITYPSGASEQTCRMRAANAGCVAPIVRRSNGAVEWIAAGGLPLGLREGTPARYQEVNASLRAGDLVILTSDGILEAHNARNELFGFERMERTIAQGPAHSAEAMLDHLRRQLAAFVGSREPHDDVTLLVIRV